MQCNIDAKGKAIRLVCGLATVVAGVVLLILAATGVLTPWWVWLIALAALGGGAFQVFEGWSGWCVIRAMGFRTPV